MKVHGVVWAGVKTERFDEMLAFFGDLFELSFDVPYAGFAVGRFPNTSQLELFGPEEGEHDHFTTGPVASFLVDDVSAAAAELRARGVEVWGPFGNRPDEGWLHFRAPDGTVWGLSTSASYRR